MASLTPAEAPHMIDALVAEVEKAVAYGDHAGRTTMLRRVTSLFTDNADRLADQQVKALDAVILQLAQNVETVARAHLSERIADVVNAPPRVVIDLAFDEDVSVAGPVLARSERLGDDALTQIAQARGQGHLYAISKRRTLSERVTDVLVVRGDSRVVCVVAGNDGARFSATGFGVMIDRSRSDSDLRATLAARRRLAAGEPQPTAPHAGKAAPQTSVDQAFQDAIDAVDAAGAVTELAESQVLAWLNEGRILEAVAAVARIADVPPKAALDAHRSADHDPMLFLLRAIRFGWGTLKLFILAKPGKGRTPEELRGAFEAFQALSVTTAQRVARFNATRDLAKKDVA